MPGPAWGAWDLPVLETLHLVADKLSRYKMFGITILKFPGRKASGRHAPGVSQITTRSGTPMRTGISAATDNAGAIALPRPPPPDRQQSRQRGLAAVASR